MATKKLRMRTQSHEIEKNDRGIYAAIPVASEAFRSLIRASLNFYVA